MAAAQLESRLNIKDLLLSDTARFGEIAPRRGAWKHRMVSILAARNLSKTKPVTRYLLDTNIVSELRRASLGPS